MFTAIALAAVIAAAPTPATVTDPYDCPTGQVARPAGEVYVCSPIVLGPGEFVITYPAVCPAGMWAETEMNVDLCVPADAPQKHPAARHHRPRHHHRHHGR